ncbi:hypothetical protein EQG49_08685 [Periweissella cryptocerci]|uniref:Uncharacterized protein n=1 Tax=Periweissella cryptocerci TaxID=2506420 RepID=A0A4V1AIS7_9LACO|nr:hypothetical protein [Periweissella cryptocerci]QBO36545.1 hypothetical protein EQG49_08685 [Periweissella cryptocerci]
MKETDDFRNLQKVREIERSLSEGIKNLEPTAVNSGILAAQIIENIQNLPISQEADVLTLIQGIQCLTDANQLDFDSAISMLEMLISLVDKALKERYQIQNKIERYLASIPVVVDNQPDIAAARNRLRKELTDGSIVNLEVAFANLKEACSVSLANFEFERSNATEVIATAKKGIVNNESAVQVALENLENYLVKNDLEFNQLHELQKNLQQTVQSALQERQNVLQLVDEYRVPLALYENKNIQFAQNRLDKLVIDGTNAEILASLEALKLAVELIAEDSSRVRTRAEELLQAANRNHLVLNDWQWQQVVALHRVLNDKSARIEELRSHYNQVDTFVDGVQFDLEACDKELAILQKSVQVAVDRGELMTVIVRRMLKVVKFLHRMEKNAAMKEAFINVGTAKTEVEAHADQIQLLATRTNKLTQQAIQLNYRGDEEGAMQYLVRAQEQVARCTRLVREATWTLNGAVYAVLLAEYSTTEAVFNEALQLVDNDPIRLERQSYLVGETDWPVATCTKSKIANGVGNLHHESLPDLWEQLGLDEVVPMLETMIYGDPKKILVS